MDATRYSGEETRCCLCWSSVMEGSYNACETLYQTQMPLKPLVALVVIITYLSLATDQSSPTATTVGANTGFCRRVYHTFSCPNIKEKSGLATRD